MKRLSLLFIVPDLNYGGAQRHVVTLLPHMNPLRFTTAVTCIGDEGELFGALTSAGVPAEALHLRGKTKAPHALYELVSRMRSAKPDVVICWGYNAETLGRLAARIARVKHTVVWVHNIGHRDDRTLLRRWFDRRLDRWTSRYVGPAKAQRTYMATILKYPVDKIRIVRNGVDPMQYQIDDDRYVLAEFGVSPADPVIGIVAALRPEKDHTTLLQAASIVLRKLPRARFLIVGDGPTRPKLEKTSSALGIDGHVIFTGARDDVGDLLRGVDVFTLCSSTVECFPLALLEAMACGRPAVCTRVGGIPEIIREGQTGFLVPVANPGGLACRIMDVLSNPTGARAMGAAGRLLVESEFSLAQSVRATEEFLEEIVQ